CLMVESEWGDARDQGDALPDHNRGPASRTALPQQAARDRDLLPRGRLRAFGAPVGACGIGRASAARPPQGRVSYLGGGTIPREISASSRAAGRGHNSGKTPQKGLELLAPAR